MKKLMSEWRNFLTESSAHYSGILKIKPDHTNNSELKTLQAMLPEEAIRLPEKDFHVTLIHQSILKPFHKQIKEIEFPPPPPIILDDEVWERESLGKKSWAVKLINQEEMQKYVKEVMESLGSQNVNPEPERRFHISLANLTGDPHDSVR